MKIGILGSGDVAKSLGVGLLARHEVMLGTRDPNKLSEWQKSSAPRAGTASFREAAAWAETVVLAVKGSVAPAVLEAVGAPALKGKVVMDATNPIADAPPVNGVIRFFTGPNESLMERLQAQMPEARFVKAFSSVGHALMVSPKLGARPSMFICGNDESAKKIVTGILEQLGWEAEDVGMAEGARAIEPLCMLWCAQSHRAAVHAVVRAGLPPERLGARLQGAPSVDPRARRPKASRPCIREPVRRPSREVASRLGRDERPPGANSLFRARRQRRHGKKHPRRTGGRRIHERPRRKRPAPACRTAPFQ
jgi:8-hydroxy-5-deazaflavin:NADPH oxidoreductase